MNELSMHTSKVNFVIFYEAWFSNICWVTLPADITVCFGVTTVETHDTKLFSLFLKCSKIKGGKNLYMNLFAYEEKYESKYGDMRRTG